jgi:hypothetical protein
LHRWSGLIAYQNSSPGPSWIFRRLRSRFPLELLIYRLVTVYRQSQAYDCRDKLYAAEQVEYLSFF